LTARLRAGVSGRHATRNAGTRAVRRARPRAALAALIALTVALSACGGRPDGAAAGAREDATLYIGAIPDQDRDRLQEIYGGVAGYLADALDVPVEYRPVTDYAAAVAQFRTGDLDLVWFGGLTGVQARAQTPGALPLVQRDIDSEFHSLFLVSADSGVRPFEDSGGLKALAGRRFTFGSQSSTSGYLMPAYYLLEAGVDPERDFASLPGFSGSHDKTIELVTSGTYEAGVVNEQVWDSRAAAGTVDAERVTVAWRTPAYSDYHWIVGPSAEEKLGKDFAGQLRRAFLDITPDDPTGRTILDLFGAKAFVPTEPANYTRIEEIGRRLGLVQGR
jgi:phosphonate transport system substrate-binding protein